MGPKGFPLVGVKDLRCPQEGEKGRETREMEGINLYTRKQFEVKKLKISTRGASKKKKLGGVGSLIFVVGGGGPR